VKVNSPERLEVSDEERGLIEPMVRRVTEARSATLGADTNAQAQLALAHATGRLQGRLDAVLLLRGLDTSEWRLGHQTDGSWYIERKPLERPAPPTDPVAALPPGQPIYRAPVDKNIRRQTINAGSVARDLGFLIDVLDRLIRLIEDGSDDFVLRQAFFSTALVTYVRTRNPDRRQAYWITDTMVAACGGTQLDDYLRGVRDKHIAHSINALEQTDVGVVIGEAHEILATVLTHVSLTEWQPADLRRLRAVVECLAARVEQDLDGLQAAVEAAAKALPINVIERGQPIGIRSATPAEVRQARDDD
jgi:hypothetical protein